MRNSFRLMRKFTPARAWNAWRVFSSYHWSKWTRNPNVGGLPISISIEPTTSCNLRCPECPSGLRKFSRPTGMLDEKFFCDTIDKLSPHLLYLNFYYGHTLFWTTQ